MKILIIQTAFIGDVILATSVLERIHSEHPEARLDFLLKKGNESLFAEHPFINRVYCFDKQQNKYGNMRRLIRIFRKESYDYVFNLQRFFSSGCMAIFSGAKQVIGFNKNPLSFFYSKKVEHTIGLGHEVDRNLALLEGFCSTERIRPKLYPSVQAFKNLKQDRSYICIAPASIWFTKQFPKEKWIGLCSILSERIFLLGGPADQELCQEILEASGHKDIHNVAGQYSLLESAALIAGAKMNYVNDSAPLHLASAMNAPVRAIFCSTVPSFGFYPLSDNSKVIEHQEELACKPCGLHGKKICPKGHFDCAKIDIEVLSK